MPDPVAPVPIILLAVCLGMLVVLLLLVLRISWRLSRLESLGVHPPSQAEPTAQAPTAQAPTAQAPTQAETSPGGAFEAFLAQDPSRRDLPKGEQFSAYRQWRQNNGMNWSTQPPETQPAGLG